MNRLPLLHPPAAGGVLHAPDWYLVTAGKVQVAARLFPHQPPHVAVRDPVGAVYLQAVVAEIGDGGEKRINTMADPAGVRQLEGSELLVN